MERKLFTETYWQEYHAGMYIILLGKAGIGKTVIINVVRQLWGALKDYHIASSDMSSAAMIDELNLAKRNVILPSQQVLEYNCLLIAPEELGTLFQKYDGGFMSILTAMWDGGKYEQSRRGHGSKQGEKISIPKPQVQFITGVTPSWLGEFLPPGAWDQGFLARTIIIYSDEKIRTSPFAKKPNQKVQFNALAGGLQEISRMWGQMYFTPGAELFGDRFAMSDDPLAPKHPKLLTYVERRPAHLIKLAMIMAASRYSGIISLEDMQSAYDLMVETEANMEHLFKALKFGGTVEIMEDAYHTLWVLYEKDGKPVSESILVHALAYKMAPFAIEQTIKIMITTGLIKLIQEPGKQNQFVPLRR